MIRHVTEVKRNQITISCELSLVGRHGSKSKINPWFGDFISHWEKNPLKYGTWEVPQLLSAVHGDPVVHGGAEAMAAKCQSEMALTGRGPCKTTQNRLCWPLTWDWLGCSRISISVTCAYKWEVPHLGPGKETPTSLWKTVVCGGETKGENSTA